MGAAVPMAVEVGLSHSVARGLGAAHLKGLGATYNQNILLCERAHLNCLLPAVALVSQEKCNRTKRLPRKPCQNPKP